MLKLTDGREFFTNKQILVIYLQQAQTSGDVFKNYPNNNTIQIAQQHQPKLRHQSR